MANKYNRVCFTGHRPDKLVGKEADVTKYLEQQIAQAIADGFTTFISGMAAGVDVLAAEAVLRARAEHPEIHLISAMPYPRFGYNWANGWGNRIERICRLADLVVNVSPTYTGKGVFQVRNEWMVNHSARLVAYWDGTHGGTYNTVMYAATTDIQIVNYR